VATVKATDEAEAPASSTSPEPAEDLAVAVAACAPVTSTSTSEAGPGVPAVGAEPAAFDRRTSAPTKAGRGGKGRRRKR
jgi:hypothetical protein